MKFPNANQDGAFGNFHISNAACSEYPEHMTREAYSALIADNLTRLLAEKHTTALALAAKCNMGRSSIYDILAGRSASPKVATVAKLAEGLNVPISDMFLTRDQLEAQSEMLSAYNLLSPDEQKRLAQVVRAWRLE